MRGRIVAFFLALAACAPIFAARIGENLIRDDFAGNGVGGILDWTVCRSLGGVRAERLAEKGPGGKPVLRLQGGIGDFSFDHTQSTFVPGEPYRLSVKVRTHGLNPKDHKDFEAYNNGWRQSVIAKIPADTKGEWVEVFWEGKMIESHNNAFTCAFYFKSIPSGAYCDISEPRMVALSEKGAAESSACPTTQPFVPRITPVEPLLCEIDSDYAWLDFFYPGDVDRTMAYELSAETCGRRVTATLGSDAHAKVVFGGIPEGTHALAVSVREKASGRVLATNAYEIVASRPFAATRGRKLNNFVTELKREPLKDGPVEFSLARDGWVFVGFDRPYAGVTADVDGIAAAVRPRDGEPSQTMRYLKAGRHVVTVKGAAEAKDGWVFVRSVKMMMLGFGRVTPKTDLNVYGGYGIDFFKAFGGYGWVNTPSLPKWMPTQRPEVVADLLDRGCQTLGSLALGSRSSVRNDLALFKSKVTSHPVWQKEQPIIIDENGIGADSLMKYNSAEVLWETGRGNHRIDVCIEDAVRCTFSTPAREIPELSALVNAGYGTSHMVPETYVPTMEDEADVQVVKDYWKDFSRRAGALVPAAPGRMVYLIGGWVWQGVFNPWYAPDVDIKEYYDDFIHMLATDPAFAEIGGIGFSTPACDEGLFRFMMHAIRHYCVDGSTERLSPRYGWKYKPGIMDNGDFTDGFAGWTPEAAEEGSLTVGHSKSFGKSAGGQLRQYNAYKLPKIPFGDDFAVFTKSARGVNRLARTLVNLTPGRLYELTFCTYDVNEIEKKGKAATDPKALTATVEGVEVIPELGYVCLGDPRKGISGRPAAIMHRVVFRATAETAKLTIDDADNAAVGTRRALNYVGARPYFVRDARDLEMIRDFGRKSMNGASVKANASVCLSGEYPDHLQDVWMDGDEIWWAHTQFLVKTDRSGNILRKAEVGGHHAGLAVKDGRLYSAVCAFNGEPRGKTTPECHVMVGEYDAGTLERIKMHVLDINDRAGSFCILKDGTYLIGCLRHPALKPSEVKFHHVDADFRLIRTHVVDVGKPVPMGIEVIRRYDDDLYLFIYDGPVVKLDAGGLSVKGRYQSFGGQMGFVRDGSFAWVGRSSRQPAGRLWKSALDRLPIVWKPWRDR